jgi:hypothetical protein
VATGDNAGAHVLHATDTIDPSINQSTDIRTHDCRHSKAHRHSGTRIAESIVESTQYLSSMRCDAIVLLLYSGAFVIVTNFVAFYNDEGLMAPMVILLMADGCLACSVSETDRYC